MSNILIGSYSTETLETIIIEDITLPILKLIGSTPYSGEKLGAGLVSVYLGNKAKTLSELDISRCINLPTLELPATVTEVSF